MRLDWGMLANHVEIQSNLAYVHGGGIDTINSPTLPATFFGSLLLRFLLHRTEMTKKHKIDIRFMMADGKEIAQFEAVLNIQPPPVMAPGASNLNPAYIALNLAGLKLENEGAYSVEVLADDVHVKSLPFSVKVIASPPRP